MTPAAAHGEVRPRVLLLHVRGDEDLAVEGEPGALPRRLVGEDLVPAGIGGEEHAFEGRAEGAVLVEHVAGRGSAAVHVADRRHAGVILTPLRHGNRLTRPAVRLPAPLAVVRREAEVGVLHHPADAARRRVVIVVLENVAERRHRLLVAVAVVVSDDLDVRAVGIHAGGETADVDVPIIAGLARVGCRVVRVFERADGVGTIGAEDAERLSRPIREHRPHVAGVPHPLAVGPHRHRMQRVVVIDPLEARQQHFTFVDCRIEAQVPIDIGVDDHVGRLCDDHLVIDDGDAERGDEARFLHERVRAVGLAVAVGVLQHDDLVALGLARMVGAVANPFGHPDPPVAVDIHVGGVAQQRRSGPQGHFEPVRHLEKVERKLHRLWWSRRLWAGRAVRPAGKAARTPVAARRPPASTRAARSAARG